jgi:hypothetical protein
MTTGHIPIELVVARAVSDVSSWGIGRELGEPRLHDDQTQDGMFDVEFPQATPPVAMEITSIADGDYLATANAAQSIVDRHLQEVAEETGRNVHWLFSVTSGTVLRRLRPYLEQVIRDGRDVGSDELPAGLISVGRELGDRPAVRIGTWSAATAGPLRGIYEELLDAVESNRAKLGAASGYERHLAVDVLALRASDPAATHAPMLPEEVDWLWVVRRAYSALRGSPVVWVTDGSGRWRVDGEPHEAI